MPTGYTDPVRKPTALAGPQWRDKTIAFIKREIDYHTTERDKEVARTDCRNLWIKQLRDSLAGAAS